MVNTLLVSGFIPLPEYMNQHMSETRRSSRLSEVLNPNYDDLSWGDNSLPSPLDDLKHSTRVRDGARYLNTAQSLPPLATEESFDSPDYQAAFLPQATSATSATSAGNGLFLPAAENLEYLGLGAAIHVPIR